MNTMGRTGRAIKDTNVWQAIDDIIFEYPGAEDNAWLQHRVQAIAQIEDEGERAPPISDIFDERPDTPMHRCHTEIDPLESVGYRPYFFIRRRENAGR